MANNGRKETKKKRKKSSSKKTSTKSGPSLTCSADSQQQVNKKAEDPEITSVDNDDDSALIAAAEAWGEQQLEQEESEEEKSTTKPSGGSDSRTPKKEKNHEKNKRKRRDTPTLNEDGSTKAASSATRERDGEAEQISKRQRQSYSLHVTQLSYKATEWDLRQHFVEQGGCLVKSVRLVYDRGLSGTKQFRGVAFVDCTDQASYEAALEKLHHSQMLERRINVRPTLSKDELQNVVQTTQKTVRQKIRKFLHEKDLKKEQQERNEKEKPGHSRHRRKKSDDEEQKKRSSSMPRRNKQKPKLDDSSSKTEKNPRTSAKEQGKSKASSSGAGQHSQATRTEKARNAPPVHKQKVTPKHKVPRKESRSPSTAGTNKTKAKLTKQERNRKAAIILSRRKQKAKAR